jgi:hypothetical protein
MTVSIYDFTIPVLTLALTNLSKQLDKAIAFADQKKFDSKQLAEARLIADMLPLAAQVHIATDNAKGACRLAGVEPPKYEDNEKTLPELRARVAKTVDFLATLKPEQFAGSETREVVLKFPQTTLKFTGKDYATKFLLPNFFFHATMAYALLRKNGVELGKGDFLGNVQ